MNKFIVKSQTALANKTAETYVDSAVKILIAIVIGALLLAALVMVFDIVVIPGVTDELNEMFNSAAGDYEGEYVPALTPGE